MAQIERFGTREAFVTAAARAIANALRAGLEARGRASLAASGGGTPVPIYEALAAETSLAWERVTVTLADERDAEDGSDHRNDKLVRRTLLRGPAKDARFVSLVGRDTLDEGLLPLDVAVMGMGEDGHTASWFPSCENLDAALDGPADAIVRTVPQEMPTNAPYERLTLTRAALAGARLPLLLVTGQDKHAVLEEAMRHGQVEEMPVRALLHAPDTNLRVMYAD